MTMTPPALHLALEAVVALVDGELSSGATTRANAHLDGCSQCRADVAAQREAKHVLTRAGGPDLPAGLLSRLREIPFSTDLGTPDVTLAMQGDSLEWTPEPNDRSRPAAPPDGLSTAAIDPAETGGTWPGPSRPAPETRPDGRPDAATGPANRPAGLSPTRLRRLRRGLVGAVAGLTVGVLAAAAPASVTPGTGASQPRVVDGNELPQFSSTFVRRLGDPQPQFAGLITGNR